MESPDPHIACRRVLDAALHEWEERMSADNVSVVVVEFDWSANSQDCSPPTGTALGCEPPSGPSPPPAVAVAVAATESAAPAASATPAPAPEVASGAPGITRAAATAAGLGSHHSRAHPTGQDVWHLDAAASEDVLLSLGQVVSHDDTASAVLQPRSPKYGAPAPPGVKAPVVITPAAAAPAAPAAVQDGAQS